MLSALVGLALAGSPPMLRPDPRGAAAPDRTFDMEHLALALTIDPDAGTVAGTATWTVRRLAPGPLRLDQIGLTIEEVRAGEAALPFRVETDALLVDVPDGATAVAIRYHATPRSGLHFRRPSGGDDYAEVWSQGEATDNRHWFPGWDSPNDRFAYEGSFAVPKGWRVLTNSGPDLVNYLVMVAAGPYEEHGDATISAWVPPGTSDAGIRRVLDPIPDIQAHLAQRTGVPYPWGPYRQVFVQRFLYTGMENTSATVEASWMVGDTTISGTRGRGIAYVVAHELAHQWYGDLLTCRGWRDLWLNEGFATFFASDWLAERRGPDDGAYDGRRHYLASQSGQALAGRFHQGPDAPANANPYEKGASVLRMLRVMLGDETFWAGIRRYTTSNAHRLVETIDLQRAVEEESGQDLGWFFQQWVELPYVPQLSVTASWEAGRSTIVVTQDTSERPPYTLPIEVELGGGAEPVVAHGWLTGDTLRLVVPVDAPPTWVAFDPRGGLLAKVDQAQADAAWEAQLASPSPYARVVAIEALGETDRSAPLSAIAEDRARSSAIRLAAIRALGEQRASGALVGLLQDPDDALRMAAAEALGKGIDTSAAAALADRVQRDAAPDVAGAALRSFAQLDASGAVRLARARLGLRRVEEARLLDAATDVVAAHGDPKDLSSLLAITGPERGRLLGVRAGARLAGRQDPGRARDRMLAQVARAAEALLDDLDQRGREGAVAVLGQIGDEASVRRLEAFRREERLPGLRAAARDAITAIRSRAAPTATPNQLDARLEALETRLRELEQEREAH